MYISSVSQHPDFSSSPCTGHVRSLPFQLLGMKTCDSRKSFCYKLTLQPPSSHVSASPSQEANTSLVRACWNELFTLGLAQCAHVMNLSTILAAIINHLQSTIQDGTDQRLRHHFTVGSTRINRSKQM